MNKVVEVAADVPTFRIKPTLPPALARKPVAAVLPPVKMAPVEVKAEDKSAPAQAFGAALTQTLDALARALALEPELLLLDEPTAGLDPDRSAAFVRLILSLRQELGLTVVLITHDLDTIVAMATRIAVLADKRIVSYASLEATLQVEHPFIERFFQGAQGRQILARANRDY